MPEDVRRWPRQVGAVEHGLDDPRALVDEACLAPDHDSLGSIEGEVDHQLVGIVNQRTRLVGQGRGRPHHGVVEHGNAVLEILDQDGQTSRLVGPLATVFVEQASQPKLGPQIGGLLGKDR